MNEGRGRESQSVAILAGSGVLPLQIADGLAARGCAHRILAFRGFADRALRRRADAVVGLLDLGGIIACLEAWRPDVVTLAGGVSRPRPSALLDVASLWRNREEIAGALGGGDDRLLRGVIRLMEEQGHHFVGAGELAPELLAEPVVYGLHRPTEAHRASISLGFRLLDAVSPFDIGQAAVLCDERVIGLEGPEGTDAMLARARAMRGIGPLPGKGSVGVLVKRPKRGQDLRVDLPAIGPRTIANAARAGLAGVAVASGLTLVLDRATTVAAANRLGLFLVGVAPEPDPTAA